jgi:pimeloyl-ACP methyl ester carboxylesterase
LTNQIDEAQAWRDRTYTSRDGLNLYFRDYPGPAGKPPLLCLHGLTRNSRDFEGFAEVYAGRHRLIIPDFRGRGRSDHDPHSANYTPPIYARDVLQLLDELEVERAIFVGTSLGGLVTMIVATFAPDRVAGALLNDVGPELDQRGLDRIRHYVGKPARFASWSEAEAALAAGNAEVLPKYKAADWTRFARRICREQEGAIVFDYDMAIAEKFHAAYSAPPVDAWPFFRALRQSPLLIVRGELSDLFAPAAAQAMADDHPNAELVTIPNIGHPPDLTEPEAIAAIDRLLGRVVEPSVLGSP